MSDDTYDVLQRQLTYAQRWMADAHATITSEPDTDRWHLDVLVRAQTEVMLFERALTDLDGAARLAATLVLDAIGGSSGEPFRNEIVRQKAHAAMEVLRVLSAVGLTAQRVGALMLR